MRLGVLGSNGCVGGALKFCFEKLGHDVVGYDIKSEETVLRDVIDCELIYLAVPTPIGDNGKCDISIVKSILDELNNLLTEEFLGSFRYKYDRNLIVVIKSTVPPGTTKWLQNLYNNLSLVFCPEFLRERCAIVDMIEMHNLLAVGTEDDKIFDLVVKSHGHYPKNIVQLTPTEAEFLKYYHNAIAALRIIFANEMFDLAVALGIDYLAVKNALIKSTKLPDAYLDISKNMRGYAGTCLPKDTLALLHLANELEIDVSLLETVVVKNEKYQKTVFPGMRA